MRRPGSVRTVDGKASPGVRRGVLASMVTVAALLLAPGAATAAPPAGHGAVKNHAPDAPSALYVADPLATCATGTAVPVRTTTPLIGATFTDRDGGNLTATFTVRDAVTGKRLWGSAPTGAQASGSNHVVQVPGGLLQDGRTYEWRVQARDAAGKKSPTVRCRIAVDVTPPVTPGVTAVAGTAPAVYLEDQSAGSIGAAGEFRFDAGESTDVVAFLYGFTGAADARVELPAGTSATTVTVVPTTSGPQVLHVSSTDAAGNVSPERVYRFTVGTPPELLTGEARWPLDDGTGTTAVDADPSAAHPLTLSPSTTWTDGLLAQLIGRETDRALLFDEPTDGATTAGPLLDTSGSYSVVALVRADAAGTAATAVSQDGDDGSAFTLGTRTDRCAEGVTSCWAFTVVGADPADPDSSSVVATSTVPVVQGDWVMLAGVRDALTGAVRLDVCSFGSLDAPGTAAVVTGTAGLVGTTAAAAGPLRLGSAQDQTSPWVGAISGARTYGTAIGLTQERRVCSSGA